MRGRILDNGKDLVIDTTAPSVDLSVGLQASAALGTTDKTYTIGDSLYFTIKFTKPVTVSADASVALETGSVDGTAVLFSGSGTDTLTFKYTVSQYEVASDLNYQSAGALTATGTIARTSTTPTTGAVLTLPFGGGLDLDAVSDLVIDGT